MSARRFADIWRGIFFMLTSVALVVVMAMFLLVWQPIWTEGFKDFHTISDAISKLDDTARPTSEVAPLMLEEVAKMNQNLVNIKTNMDSMTSSMKSLENVNPNIVSLNYSMAQMTQAMTGQMRNMNYEIDRMGDKFSPLGMMPFNW